jgi:hypothetical protein
VALSIAAAVLIGGGILLLRWRNHAPARAAFLPPAAAVLDADPWPASK